MAEKKKQLVLRISDKLYEDLVKWAQDDFRSINGQIEFILNECVKQRKKNGKYIPEDIDKTGCSEIEEFISEITKGKIC